MITALSHHVLCTSLVPSATPEWIWGTPRSWADRRARQRRLSDEADARPDARPVSRISHRPACPPWARPASSWRLGGMAEADQGRPGRRTRPWDRPRRGAGLLQLAFRAEVSAR